MPPLHRSPKKASPGSPRTSRSSRPPPRPLYLQAARGFYKYLAAERLATINLPRLDLLKQQRARRLGVRLPQFPTSDIERLLEYVSPADFVNSR